MHLVDDENLVASHLRRDASLLHQRLDVLYGVVACSVKFEYVVRALLVERLAALALVACLAVGGGAEAVDGFGENACTGGLSHAARTAEEVGMGKLAALHSVLQRGGESRLSHDGVECRRTVFACGNDVFSHCYFLFSD